MSHSDRRSKARCITTNDDDEKSNTDIGKCISGGWITEEKKKGMDHKNEEMVILSSKGFPKEVLSELIRWTRIGRQKTLISSY
jgi:hypothetical protein